jgi:hypothetical protein
MHIRIFIIANPANYRETVDLRLRSHYSTILIIVIDLIITIDLIIAIRVFFVLDNSVFDERFG